MYTIDAFSIPTHHSSAPVAAVAAARLATTTATSRATRARDQPRTRSIRGSVAPLGLDVPAGELLEQAVDGVEERLGHVVRQHVAHRVLGPVRRACPHRGAPKVREV